MASVPDSYTDARKSSEYTSTRTPKSGFVAGLARATKLPDMPMYRRRINAEKQGKTLTRPMSGYCCLSQPETGCECALGRPARLVSGKRERQAGWGWGGWVDRTGATGGLTVAPRDVNRGCRLVLQTSSASEAPRFVCCSIFTVPKVSGVRLTDGLHYRSFHKNAIL